MQGYVSDRTKWNCFKLEEEKFRLKKQVFCSERSKTLEQVFQKGGSCPILGNIQVGWSSDQLDLVKVGIDDL